MTDGIRAAQDDDAWDLVGLVAGCWSEYPGCVLDVNGEAPELLAIASHYSAAGGRVWVVEDGRGLAGCIAMRPGDGPHAARLEKLYVAGRARRRGLGTELVALVETEALARGAVEIDLWSDTRFEDAHRLYERLGYARDGQSRELHDLSHTIEYHFRKSLAPNPG